VETQAGFGNVSEVVVERELNAPARVSFDAITLQTSGQLPRWSPGAGARRRRRRLRAPGVPRTTGSEEALHAPRGYRATTRAVPGTRPSCGSNSLVTSGQSTTVYTASRGPYQSATEAEGGRDTDCGHIQ
jgi:hypothetical protein